MRGRRQKWGERWREGEMRRETDRDSGVGSLTEWKKEMMSTAFFSTVYPILYTLYTYVQYPSATRLQGIRLV